MESWEDHNSDTPAMLPSAKTPLSPKVGEEVESEYKVFVGKKTNLNFGAVSSRDEIIFGCAGPGFKVLPRRDRPTTPRLVHSISSDDMSEWLNELTQVKKIRRFLVLLSQTEMRFYKGDFLAELESNPAVKDVTFVSSMSESGALSSILKSLYNAFKNKEKLAVFDYSGQVRTGLVGSLWVHHKYFVEVSVAVNEVIQYSQEIGTIRRPKLRDVVELLTSAYTVDVDANTASARGVSDISSSVSRLKLSETAWGTPRSVTSARSVKSSKSTSRTAQTSIPDNQAEILIVTTGGTIDKDYPRATGGYAFEIGQPAALGIMKRLKEINALGFSYSIVSVCRKDSQDIVDIDRECIWRECTRFDRKLVLVTHGTDTMIETAQFLLKRIEESKLDLTIVLTGAVRPEKFAVSDASFNVGLAIGVLWTAKCGVYLCMNGKVFPFSSGLQMRRDQETGLYCIDK